MNQILGFFSPMIVYLMIFILNAIVPGRWVKGYVTKEGSNDPLKYRLNGLYVLIIMISIWLGLGYLDLMPWDYLYQVRWYGLAGAISFGLVFSLAIVIPYPPVRKNILADFFLGRLMNPQLWGGRIDAKMWLYLIGAILLELNILSFASHHYLQFGLSSSMGIFLATALLSYFVFDYLTFEEIHLYTYDLFAERVGFKLGWGCIAFYPYFYSIPIWSTVDLPATETPIWLMILAFFIFFGSWSLARGANMQKYYFKKYPGRKFLWIQPESISDGQKMLLVNGYWGLSRHINYLGEIGMATGIVLATGHPEVLWAWLYPLYYVVLLFTRQMDDDKRCALKYGPLWDEYLKKVPYRIIPYIY